MDVAGAGGAAAHEDDSSILRPLRLLPTASLFVLHEHAHERLGVERVDALHRRHLAAVDVALHLPDEFPAVEPADLPRLAHAPVDVGDLLGRGHGRHTSRWR